MNFLISAAVLFALFQAPPAVTATFSGLYRGMESGRLVVEVENGQNMRMFVTGSTKFVRDGKPSRASQFHDGDTVSVDAERDLRMNLVAVRVEAVRAKPPSPDSDKDK